MYPGRQYDATYISDGLDFLRVSRATVPVNFIAKVRFIKPPSYVCHSAADLDHRGIRSFVVERKSSIVLLPSFNIRRTLRDFDRQKPMNENLTHFYLDMHCNSANFY